MRDRVRSAIIFAVLMLGWFAAGYASPIFLTLFWLLFCLAASKELSELLDLRQPYARCLILLFVPAILLPSLLPGLSAPVSAFLFLACSALVFITILMAQAILLGPETLDKAVRIGLGGIYLAFPAFAAESLLREMPKGWYLLILAFVSPWITDTAAWFFGRHFGRRKAFPRLSPGKTWAGVLGALLASSAAYALLISSPFGAAFAENGFPGWKLPFLGIVLSLAAQLGDLLESALKRRAGVKDSGSLIPGHGGLLDRFDSTLFLLPVLYFIVVLRSLF